MLDSSTWIPCKHCQLGLVGYGHSMRLPWRSRRQDVSPPCPDHPDVEYDGFGKGVDVVALARFVRARVEDDAAAVDRYGRSRGRKPLPGPW